MWNSGQRVSGQLSHTKHILYKSPARVRVTRRYHPLLGQELEVLKADKQTLVVRLADGSALKMPRAWTDAAEASGGHHSALLTVFSVNALRELMTLVDALRNRD